MQMQGPSACIWGLNKRKIQVSNWHDLMVRAYVNPHVCIYSPRVHARHKCRSQGTSEGEKNTRIIVCEMTRFLYVLMTLYLLHIAIYFITNTYALVQLSVAALKPYTVHSHDDGLKKLFYSCIEIVCLTWSQENENLLLYSTTYATAHLHLNKPWADKVVNTLLAASGSWIT